MLSISSAQLEAWVAMFIWPFLRIITLVMAAPLLGHRAIPRRARIGLALFITVLIAPTLPAAPPPGSAETLGLVAQQVLVGLSMALVMHIAFAAVALAGDLIGLQMGLSFATFVDPTHAGQTPLLGTLLGLFATLVFFAIDGHLIMIAALAESCEAVPLAGSGLQSEGLAGVLAWGGTVFRIGLHLSLPVLAAMLACNLALGALMRAAPQLNLFAVGFPVTLVVGFLMLALLLPYLGTPLQNHLLEALATLHR